jgi:hypothetical protein
MNTVLKFECPQCGQNYETESTPGSEIKCQACDTVFVPASECMKPKAAPPAPGSVMASEIKEPASALEDKEDDLRQSGKLLVWIAVVVAVLAGLFLQNIVAAAAVLGSVGLLAFLCFMLSRLTGIHASIVAMRQDLRRLAERREK